MQTSLRGSHWLARMPLAALVLLSQLILVLPNEVRADDCPSCSQSAAYNLRMSKAGVPSNGTMKIGRFDEFNIVGVFRNGELVDFYLKHHQTGNIKYGNTQVKSLTIFSKCFTKNLVLGKKIEFCITVKLV